ncbi:sensor histidine kinase [Streptomyces pathocidini]|uniref:histidine kinase n=1 Tax=Streptomyces pathocidini TaxID=1650571 RepID=A0ABW7US73_9ACTN|nr:histidine kinase [Streptomyces pathocidini]
MLLVTTLAPGPALARPRGWLRAHPLALDLAVASVVLTLMITGMMTERRGMHGSVYGAHSPEPLSVVLAALAAGALVARRRAPRTVLAVTGGLTLVEILTGPGGRGTPVAMTAAIALFTVGSRTSRSTTWRIALLTAVGLTASAMLFGPEPWYGQENLAIFAWTGMAAAVGDAVRSRRAFVDAIRERAERAERTREEEARRRVAEERMRIARELHDVVAHHIALVNVQAGVAAHVMDNRPDQAKEALAHVREASRSALNELRATVGLLRQYGDPEAPTEPAPGLGLLDQLVDGFARAGLPVEVEISSTAARGPWHSRRPEDAPAVIGELPAGVDLTAYRVVQEALTNTHKHAGEEAGAIVRIARAWDFLEVTVLDDGVAGEGAPVVQQRSAEAARGGETGGGHGLLGMRERAAALGGECEAGPRYGGGFRVHVRLPLTVAREAAREGAP